MNRSEVEKGLLKIIHRQVDSSERKRVTLDTAFEQLEFDSLDRVEVIIGIEETFSLRKIPDEKTYEFKDGNQITDYICEQKGYN